MVVLTGIRTNLARASLCRDFGVLYLWCEDGGGGGGGGEGDSNDMAVETSKDAEGWRSEGSGLSRDASLLYTEAMGA